MSGDNRKKRKIEHQNITVPQRKILSNIHIESIHLFTSLFVRTGFLVMSMIATDAAQKSFGAQTYSRMFGTCR